MKSGCICVCACELMKITFVGLSTPMICKRLRILISTNEGTPSYPGEAERKLELPALGQS